MKEEMTVAMSAGGWKGGGEGRGLIEENAIRGYALWSTLLL